MSHRQRSGTVRVRLVLASLTSLTLCAAFMQPAAVAATISGELAAVLGGDLSPEQWALSAIRAPEAWTTSTGKGEIVAVVDTGVDASNPDLAGQLVDGAIVSAEGGGRWTAEPVPAAESEDPEGHGTHVAGIVVARPDDIGVTGVAPGAKVMPIDVMTSANDASTLAEVYAILATGIDYAVSHGADVVSMSLGSDADEVAVGAKPGTNDAKTREAEALICAAVLRASSAGIPVVVAAGNSGLDSGGANGASMPAACPTAVSVGAVGEDLSQATFWSSTDATVAISAPGAHILSTIPVTKATSAFPYALMSGTSMATPIVSGVAALVLAYNPGMTVDELRQRLVSTATDVSVPGVDPMTGAGIVDAAAAVGANSRRSAPLPAGSFLSVQVRSANSIDDPDARTVSWKPPLRSELPDYYSVALFDGSNGAAPIQEIVSGAAVRATIDVEPSIVDPWVVVYAEYGDGVQVMSVPEELEPSVGPILPPSVVCPKIVVKSATWSGPKLLVRWQSSSSKGLSGLMVVVNMSSSTGGLQESSGPILRPNAKGAFPTAAAVTFKGLPVPASYDWDVALVPVSQDVGGAPAEACEDASNTLHVQARQATSAGTVLPSGKNNVAFFGQVNLSALHRWCSKGCSGFVVRVTTTSRSDLRSNGKLVTSWTRTKVVGSRLTQLAQGISDEVFFAYLPYPSSATKTTWSAVILSPKGKPIAPASPAQIISARDWSASGWSVTAVPST